MHVQLNLVNQFVKGKLKMHLVSEALTISVIFSTVHEVGREQGVLTISVVFSTVHEVGREQGVLTISVVFNTVYDARSTY
jgi:nitrate reductase NapAB chaperone NapD